MSVLGKSAAWAVALAGLAVLVLTYVQAAFEGVYFDERALPDNISSAPELGLGVVGLLLLFGGIAAGVARRQGER